MSSSDTIEAQGHLIDSGLLSALFDKIIEFRGSYEILAFDIGRTNDDPSRIQMRITAPDRTSLDDLLQQIPKLIGRLTMTPPFMYGGNQSVHTALPLAASARRSSRWPCGWVSQHAPRLRRPKRTG